MRPTVLLFDIDGTLISTGGAGRRAIESAFARRFGRADAFTGFSFGGMTDRAILRAGLSAIGRAPDEGEMDELIALYLGILAEEMAAESACIVHPGVEPALDAVVGRARVAVGLGTGNVREGARLKLTKKGLYQRFSFGGFGCDHELRHELLRIGAERGALELGAPLGECRVVVIGDTPKDIDAAKAIGAECIAVATGFFREDALAACGPTRVFRDLTAPGALAALLG